MKKIILGFITVCLSFCTLAFVACGGSNEKTDEEQFNEAKQQFDNYTVEAELGNLANTSLMIDNGKAKYTVSNEYFSAIMYFKAESGTIYKFDDGSEKWEETNFSTLEEAVDGSAEYDSCFSAFTALYYDDLIKQDDYFTMTDNALESFSSLVGYEMSSFRLKIENNKFTSATVIVEFSGTRLEISYTFKDYGSTTVELPA